MATHNRHPSSHTLSDPVPAAHWLAVKAAESAFLIPLSHSGEIFPWVSPHSVPYTKAWFLGVVNLRGALCGVVDLSKLMNSAAHPSGASSMASEKCFISFHASLEMNTVIAVDQLLGLRSLSEMTPKSPSIPRMLGEYVDISGRVWQEIDMFGLARDADFVNISAIN